MRRILAALLVVALLAPAAVAQSEDTSEPQIEWSSPWERGQYDGLPDDWTASNGTLHLQATIHDASAIERVTIQRRYQSEVDGDQESSRRTIRLGSTDQIDTVVHAGTFGTTTLTITVRDAAGNTHVERITVDVEDTTAPTANLSATLVEDGIVRVRGTVTDDTQVGEIRLHAVSATTVVSPQQGRVDITRNTVEIDDRVQAPPKGVDGAVTVDLVDRAGNTRTVMVPVNATATPTPTATPTATPQPTATPTARPTVTPTATPTPTSTVTATPTTTPAASGRSGWSIFDVLKLVGIAVAGLLGGVVVASYVTGGRY